MQNKDKHTRVRVCGVVCMRYGTTGNWDSAPVSKPSRNGFVGGCLLTARCTLRIVLFDCVFGAPCLLLGFNNHVPARAHAQISHINFTDEFLCGGSTISKHAVHVTRSHCITFTSNRRTIQFIAINHFGSIIRRIVSHEPPLYWHRSYPNPANGVVRMRARAHHKPSLLSSSHSTSVLSTRMRLRSAHYGLEVSRC